MIIIIATFGKNCSKCPSDYGNFTMYYLKRKEVRSNIKLANSKR